MISATTLLMVELTEDEQMLVKQLTSSFEIKLESVKKIGSNDYANLSYEKEIYQKEICLVIVHVDHDATREIDNIRCIRKLLSVPVPLLVLVSYELSSDINSYMKAGADDYILMPLNGESFAMRFYVLLECGQAILETRRNNKTERETDKALSEKNRDAWRLIVGYLQEGLSFFTPRYQLARRDGRTIFDKWKPLRKLATGADGTIWLVEEMGKERVAVAKIPHSPQMNINSLRAAAVLKRLVYHPNIAHLIEVVKDDQKFILIIEYVEGITLWEHLSSGISSQEKERLFLQILSVIAYSHDHKIMHRDIKPDNIMVRGDGGIKLLDFGSAKEVDWRDRNNSPEGTLNFMPPEQFEGRACLASDVWALGVILYLLALNRLPFYQDNSSYPMDIDMDMTALPPSKIRPDIPAAFEQVIMRSLERSLDIRYENASAFRDDLMEKFPGFGDGMQIKG